MCASTAYPGDGRDGEHAEHGRGKVLEALEEVDERRACAAGGVDAVLVEFLLAGEPQGDRHGDYDEDLINKQNIARHERNQNLGARTNERRSNDINGARVVTHHRSQEGALEVRAGIAARRGFEPREPAVLDTYGSMS